MAPRDVDQLLKAPDLPPLPAQRIPQIESAIVADLKPVRPLASDATYLAAFAGIFLIVCIAGCYIVGQLGWRALNETQRFAIFLPLVAMAALLDLAVVRQMRPAAKYGRSAALISAILLASLALIMAILFQPVSETAFVRHGIGCYRTGITFAIPAALLFALLLLRGAALSPLLTGATAGGFAGLVGLVVLEVHCPNLNLYHIIVWHLSVTLTCIFLGFVFSGVTFGRRLPNH